MTPTWDEAKRERDGHTSAGTVHPDDPKTWMWPVTTSYGLSAAGEVVCETRAYGPRMGEVAFGDRHREAVRWEDTPRRAVLFPRTARSAE